jgi:hypothetical protein
VNSRFFFVLLAALAGPALAITPTTNPTPPPGMSSRMQKPQAASASSVAKPAEDTGMRSGTVQKVDLSRGTFHVYGQPVAFDPKRVRIIGADGKPAPVSTLKAGAQIRFMVEPADKAQARAGVIFLR